MVRAVSTARRATGYAEAAVEARGIATRGDHVHEPKDFANGLRNSTVRLKKMLGSDNLEPAARAKIQELLGNVSRLRDKITETLQR